MTDSPVLYSFRRCPYAIRARLALQVTGRTVELREVVLKHKPASMLLASPKATVPVLVLPNIGDVSEPIVIDESLDIMRWAFSDCALTEYIGALDDTAEALISRCDNEFKYWLDRYKYFERYPEHNQSYYWEQAQAFLETLEQMLKTNGHYLAGQKPGFLDLAIFPFVRQFAHVDRDKFFASRHTKVIAWLEHWLASDVFLAIMQKYPAWTEGDAVTVFP